MKKISIAVAVLVLMLGVYCSSAADAVEPAGVTFTNTRAESAQTVIWAGATYFGQSLCFTNCRALVSTSETQGLDGVTVSVSVGTLTTNIDYTATVMTAAAGTWFCTITVPSNTQWHTQVRLVDSNTNTYIYPKKIFVSEESMF